MPVDYKGKSKAVQELLGSEKFAREFFRITGAPVGSTRSRRMAKAMGAVMARYGQEDAVMDGKGGEVMQGAPTPTDPKAAQAMGIAMGNPAPAQQLAQAQAEPQPNMVMAPSIDDLVSGVKTADQDDVYGKYSLPKPQSSGASRTTPSQNIGQATRAIGSVERPIAETGVNVLRSGVDVVTGALAKPIGEPGNYGYPSEDWYKFDARTQALIQSGQLPKGPNYKGDLVEPQTGGVFSPFRPGVRAGQQSDYLSLKRRAFRAGIPADMFDRVSSAYGNDVNKVTKWVDAREKAAKSGLPPEVVAETVAPPAGVPPAVAGAPSEEAKVPSEIGLTSLAENPYSPGTEEYDKFESEKAKTLAVRSYGKVPAGAPESVNGMQVKFQAPPNTVEDDINAAAAGDEAAKKKLANTSQSDYLQYIRDLIGYDPETGEATKRPDLWGLQTFMSAVEEMDDRNGTDRAAAYRGMADAVIAGMSGEQWKLQEMMDRSGVWNLLGVDQKVADQLGFDLINGPDYEKLWRVAESRESLRGMEEDMEIAWSQSKMAPLAFEEYVAGRDTFYKKLDGMINDLNTRSANEDMSDPQKQREFQMQGEYLVGLRSNVANRYATYVDRSVRMAEANAAIADKRYSSAYTRANAMFQRAATTADNAWKVTSVMAEQAMNALWEAATGKRNAVNDALSLQTEAYKAQAESLAAAELLKEFKDNPDAALNYALGGYKAKTSAATSKPYDSTAMRSYLFTDNPVSKDAAKMPQGRTLSQVSAYLAQKGSDDYEGAGTDWGNGLADYSLYGVSSGDMDIFEAFSSGSEVLGQAGSAEGNESVIDTAAQQAYTKKFLSGMEKLVNAQDSSGVASAVRAAMKAKSKEDFDKAVKSFGLPSWLTSFIWDVLMANGYLTGDSAALDYSSASDDDIKKSVASYFVNQSTAGEILPAVE